MCGKYHCPALKIIVFQIAENQMNQALKIGFQKNLAQTKKSEIKF